MWLVFLKEIKELLRDRKTLFFMIALPILVFPAIFGVVTYVSSKAIQKAESEILDYAIVGAEYAPDLVARIAESEEFNLVTAPQNTDIKQWVKEENADFVLVIPENFSNDVLANGQISLTLYLNDSGLNLVQRRLNEIVDAIEEENQQSAFSTLGLNETQQVALIDPVLVEKVNVADQRENWGEKIGGFIPYLVFMLCLQGAMIPATDLGAGEKERGTLETLLISPIARHKLVLGKFMAIALAGVTSAMVTVGSMAIWGIVLSQGMAIELVADFMGSISGMDFLLIFFMLIPVVAIFASVLLSLSIYARSFKEAQGYMTPLVMFTIVPVIMA